MKTRKNLDVCRWLGSGGGGQRFKTTKLHVKNHQRARKATGYNPRAT